MNSRHSVHRSLLLLPMVQLIEQSQAALDEVADVTGRTMIELILQVSAEQVAGGKSPGKRTGEIRHHGTQGGVVHLKERKLRVNVPAFVIAPRAKSRFPPTKRCRRVHTWLSG